MAHSSLEKLLGHKSPVGKGLADLSAHAHSPFSIEDSSGKVLFDGNSVASGQRFPIEVDDQVLGWVTGNGNARLIATLLSHSIRQENEKKSLVNELTDRYRELSLLYHLSERLAASPEPESVSEIALEEIRRLIKADSGAVLLLDEGDLRVIAAFGDSWQTLRQEPLLEQILRTGKAELNNQIVVESPARGEEGFRFPVLGAPLKTERRSLGIIFLVGSHSQDFTAGDLKLLNTIAMQAAPAFELSRLYQESIEKARYEHELHMARHVQESLLPLQMPDIHGWAAASRWRPAREVSGDFYDIIAENGSTVDLVIADVTDKGMPASLFMAFTRSILRVSIFSGEAPASIITSVNQAICRDSYQGLFTTLVYARLDQKTGQLTYVNAGHNPPLLYHASSGEIETLGRTGLTLGVDQESTYTQKTVQMDAGDILLFYTDGITEAANSDKQEFGIERLKQQVLRYRACKIEVVLNEIEAAVLAHASHGQPMDDVTMMGLKRE